MIELLFKHDLLIHKYVNAMKCMNSWSTIPHMFSSANLIILISKPSLRTAHLLQVLFIFTLTETWTTLPENWTVATFLLVSLYAIFSVSVHSRLYLYILFNLVGVTRWPNPIHYNNPYKRNPWSISHSGKKLPVRGQWAALQLSLPQEQIGSRYLRITASLEPFL